MLDTFNGSPNELHSALTEDSSIVLRQELHPIRVNEVRMQPFSSAHPTRPTGCTTVLHFHPHTRISCPPRACTMRASGQSSERGNTTLRVCILRGMTVPGHMAER